MRLYVFLVAFIFLVPEAQSATFYIDSVSGSDSYTSAQAQSQATPWAHMPGMSGCTSNCLYYSIQAGDVFVLKGGSVWKFASRIDDLITVQSSYITIRGGQQLGWGNGYPVIDGETSNETTRAGIYSSNKNHVVVDGLKIINTLNPDDGSGFGFMIFGNASSWEIKNCQIDNAGVNSVGYAPDNGSSFLLHNNTISNSGRVHIAIITGVTFDDVQIFNNTFLGTGTWPAHDYHGDGLMIGADSTENPSTFTNIAIHHNKFLGNWTSGATALVYLNGDPSHYGGYHVLIYDNQFAIDSDGTLSPAFVYIAYGWKDVKIFNNVFNAVMSGGRSISHCISFSYLDSDAGFVIKNNILSGCDNGISTDVLNSSGFTADYNLFYTVGNNHFIWDKDGRYNSLDELRAHGYEAHGIVSLDPKFVALPNGTTGSGDWRLRADSPAIDSGADLSAYFTTDIAGTTRPQGAGWDIGAYEYAAAAQACGNGIKEEGEACDGTDLSGSTCATMPGFKSGMLACRSDCLGLDVSQCRPGWQYNWSLRTDEYGKPAGIFNTTPFPINENSASYYIINDEGVHIYELGAKYYVDGGYDMRNGPSNGSWDRPWVSIRDALDWTGSGNIAIIIRGAHNRWGNNFNGTYYGIYSLSNKAGLNDTNRFLLAGYWQERPVLDGQGVDDDLIYRSSSTQRDAFITLQRLKLQNVKDRCIRLGWDANNDKRANYFNTIDVHMYRCGYTEGNFTGFGTDGSVYYLNVDNGWIYHSTSEYTYGHAYKMGDGTSNHVIEWSVANNIGWWSGVYDQHVHSPVAFDFPTDADDGDMEARDPKNLVARYNIAHAILNYALQIRGGRNLSAHHNEFYDIIHHDEIPPSGQGTFGKIAVLIYAGQASGDFYSNIIRDPGNNGTLGLYMAVVNTANAPVNIFNNLFYGFDQASIMMGTGNRIPANIFSNTIYGTSNASAGDKYGPLVSTQSSAILRNNVLYQKGSMRAISPCIWVSNCSIERSNNLYYAPAGSIGLTLNASEIYADPLFRMAPAGAYLSGMGELAQTSPAIGKGMGLGSAFATDILGTARPQGAGWDIGAYEYAGIGRADVNQNGCIELSELAAFIIRWKVSNADVGLRELISTIASWKRGC